MLAVGRTIDRYTVEAELGAGGVATVYRVRHNQLGSTHALKVLQLHGHNIRERLIEEGKAQARLKHPNVVTVTDVIDVDGAPGLIMEFIDGPSLDKWLRLHAPTLEQAEGLFRGILAGVARAHRFGIVHRDLKPGNVLIESTEEGLVPKVADFGLAKALIEHTAGRAETRSGIAMGTPAYMAPEQVRDSKNVDQRADVFALGCILYELCVGVSPFDGPDVLTIFSKLASGTYTPPEVLNPDIPVRVRNAIVGALSNRREERIPDCATLRAVLDGASFTPSPTLAPPGAAEVTGSTPAASLHRTQPSASAGAAPGVAIGGAVSAAPSRPGSAPTMALSQLPPAEASFPASLVPPEEPPPRPRGGGGVGVALAVAGGLGLVGLLLLTAVGGWWWSRQGGGEPAPTVVESPGPSSPPTTTGTATAEPVPAPASASPTTASPATASPTTGTAGVTASPPPSQPAATSTPPRPTPTTGAAATGPTATASTGSAPAASSPTSGGSTPAAAGGTGQVVFAGDASEVWLEGPSGRVGAGAVPAGDYRIRASFGGAEPVSAGRVSVREGASHTVTCNSEFQICKAR